MKLFITFILTAAFLTFIGCGNEDNLPQGKVKSSISAPKLPLHAAVIQENIEVIRQHISAGSDLNIVEPTRKSTPLISAAAFGKTQAAKLLIEAGADLNLQNKDGSTALHSAAFFCHEEIVKTLLENGADKTIKNKFGNTAFESVLGPFEDVKHFYDELAPGFKTLGITFDYEYIKATRPKIAEMLK